MASIAGAANTFSTQTSMAAPVSCDRTAVNKGTRQRLLSEPVGSGVGNSKINSSGALRALGLKPRSTGARLMLLTLMSDLKVRPPVVFGIEGSSCKSTPHPAYGSELSTGGGRLVRA